MSDYRFPVSISGPAGGPFINVWHIHLADAQSTVQNIQTRVSAIRAFYASCATNVSGVGSILAPNMTVSAEFVTDVSSQAQFAISWAALNTGAYGQVAPTRLALAVNWKTGTAARRARGRTFVGPLEAGTSGTDGLPKQAIVDNLLGYARTLRTACSADGFGYLGVYGLVTAGGEPTDPHITREVTDVALKRHFATLRTRG